MAINIIKTSAGNIAELVADGISIHAAGDA